MALVDVGLPSTTPFGAIEDQFCPVTSFFVRYALRAHDYRFRTALHPCDHEADEAHLRYSPSGTGDDRRGVRADGNGSSDAPGNLGFGAIRGVSIVWPDRET